MTVFSKIPLVYKIAAAALLTLLPVALICLWAISVWQSNNEEIDNQLMSLDHLKSVANYKSNLKELATASNPQVEQEFLLPGGTKAEIAAELQTKLKIIASSLGLNVLSSTDLKEKNEQPLTFIGSSFQLSGTLTAFLSFLESVQREKPQMYVTSYSINSAANSQDEISADTVLSIQISIFAATRTNRIKELKDAK